jgi:imidazolonepropionase-like amidohydrolase
MADATGRITITAGRLLDVVTGRILTDQAIVVANGRIETVGPSQEAGETAFTIDLSQHTVLPGLIDCHTHILAEPNPRAPLAIGSSGARDALLGVRHARSTLLAGITTVRDCGPFRALTDVALRDAINEGIVPGPRMLASGAYMSVTAGAADIMWVTPDVRQHLPLEVRFGLADSPDEVRKRVREILHGGADFIKVNATGAFVAPGTRPDVGEFSEAELRAAVEEAAKYGTHVAAHAHGAEGIKTAVRAGVRSIEHGWMLDDEGARMMKQSGTYLVPTLWAGERRRSGDEPHSCPKCTPTDGERQRIERMGLARDVAFRRALSAGVLVAFGTDAGTFEHGLNATELQVMAEFGMPALETIRSATIRAAELLGRASELGSIQPGRRADIIAVAGDPLDDLGHLLEPAFVMKEGQIYKSPTVGM